MSFLSSSNYSIYAIPVYYIFTLIPHAYAITIAKNANNGQWNNASPRSTTWNEKVQKSIPAAVFARHERAEAAHKNGMENSPLIYTAIILGNVAQLPNETLNSLVGLYLLSRVGYTYAYINIENNNQSWVRSAVWALGVGFAMSLIVMAGNKLR